MGQFPWFHQPRKPVAIQQGVHIQFVISYSVWVAKKPFSTLTVPPLSTWKIHLCFPLASARPPRYLTFFKSVTPSWFLCGGSAWPTLNPAGSLLCWSVPEVWGDLFLLERGSLLIWLLRDSTGVLASRQSGHRDKWKGVVGLGWLLAPLWRRVQGSNGEIGGKHAWYLLVDCWEGAHAEKLNGHTPKLKGALLWIPWVNILTFDLLIGLGNYN